MSEQEQVQAAEMAQTKAAIKQAYLKALQEELQKLAESPETVARINEHASLLAEAHAGEMVADIEVARVRRLNEIKRDGARWRVILCPLITIAFSGVAWFNFARSNMVLGIEFVVFALAFVAMLVLGAIFDRPW